MAAYLTNKTLTMPSMLGTGIASIQSINNFMSKESAKVAPITFLKGIEEIDLGVIVVGREGYNIPKGDYEVTQIVLDEVAEEVYLYLQGPNIHYRVTRETFRECFEMTSKNKLKDLFDEKLTFNLFNDNNSDKEE